MKKLIVLGVGTAGVAAMALLGAGAAAADDYAGATYAQAAQAAAARGEVIVIVSRMGSGLPDSQCIVARSQETPFTNDLGSGSHIRGTLHLYLNCED